FATLDPTTRRLRLPTNQNVLLSDTVGFIRKLPHQLVDSFKATLEEVVRADVLLHVVDISHPLAEEHIQSVHQTLTEIGAQEKPTLMVLNKIDREGCGLAVNRIREQYPNVVAISAKTHAGFEELMAEIGAMLRPIRVACELGIPHTESAMIARLHAVAQVVSANYDDPEIAKFFARIPPYLENEFKAYILSDEGSQKEIS
ncbi:MAG: 50S ribosome-binding GTPase, partial [Verrucomicrobia bacterium]|nr:50S ribosome-binding GTPase [Verrucomicrobiota bacterium]